MNLPNKITMLRVFLIPFFVVFMLVSAIPYSKYIALVIFVVASLTDTLDGYIARKYKLVSNFGKFMDPLADKLLVSSAMICLVSLNRIPAWVVIVIISREFIISGFRLVASDAGELVGQDKNSCTDDHGHCLDLVYTQSGCCCDRADIDLFSTGTYGGIVIGLFDQKLEGYGRWKDVMR